MKRPPLKLPLLNWFKARRTAPFVLPVTLTRATDKYVYPLSQAGTSPMRYLRISAEAAYFETEAEAYRHVQKQQGKTDEHENRGATTGRH